MTKTSLSTHASLHHDEKIPKQRAASTLEGVVTGNHVAQPQDSGVKNMCFWAILSGALRHVASSCSP